MTTTTATDAAESDASITNVKVTGVRTRDEFAPITLALTGAVTK